MFNSADQILNRAFESGVFTHATCAVTHHGDVVYQAAFGNAVLDTIFDLASLTKPVSTATLTLQLAEAGKCDIDEHVTTFFPVREHPHLAGVRIRHLLTHTSGLPPIPRTTRDDQSWADASLSTSLTGPVGTKFQYSDTGYIILGEISKIVSGPSLAVLFRENIARPMGFADTGFNPGQVERIAPTGVAPGQPHDPRTMHGESGHAGLFGTAIELLQFLEKIRTGGAPILSAASAKLMSTNQCAPNVAFQSFGWFCQRNGLIPSGDFLGPDAFGHSGFTGTMVIIDPTLQLSMVLLTNRVLCNPTGSGDYLRVRRAWVNAIAQAIRSVNS